MATETPPPNQPPAGWYADPNNAGGQRYWDGETWTDHAQGAQPLPPLPASPALGSDGKEQHATGVIVAGYIFAVLIPLVGFIIGLTQINRNRHGLWVVLASVGVFFAWIVILAIAAAGSETCVNGFGETYSC